MLTIEVTGPVPHPVLVNPSNELKSFILFCEKGWPMKEAGPKFGSAAAFVEVSAVLALKKLKILKAAWIVANGLIPDAFGGSIGDPKLGNWAGGAPERSLNTGASLYWVDVSLSLDIGGPV